MSTISIQGMQLLLLSVGDLEQSRRFYGDLLGLSVEMEVPGHLLEYSVGNVSLMLHKDMLHKDASSQDAGNQDAGNQDAGDANAIRPNPAAGVDIYLGVTDVDHAIGWLRTEGVTILEEPATQPWGKRDACVLDPDGYRIHLSSERLATQGIIGTPFPEGDSITRLVDATRNRTS